MITQSLLMEWLRYDPRTGIFVWNKERTGRGRPVRQGTVAGCRKRRDGYVNISICGRYYKAHRLAWLYVYGEMPNGGLEIDHRNGDRSDNRIENLRLATRSQNCANRRLQVTNQLRRKGVFFCDGMKTRKYGARICLKGKLRLIGYFDSPDKAQAAYVAEAQRVFGEFARAG